MILSVRKNIGRKILKKGFDDDFTKSALSKIYTELNIFSKAEEIVNEMIAKNPEKS